MPLVLRSIPITVSTARATSRRTHPVPSSSSSQATITLRAPTLSLRGLERPLPIPWELPSPQRRPLRLATTPSLCPPPQATRRLATPRFQEASSTTPTLRLSRFAWLRLRLLPAPTRTILYL